MAGELHQKLVAAAARWLESVRRCCLVATDIVTACGETPDAIGWYGTYSILVECKASLADFRRDATKPSRQRGGSRASLGSLRYYFAPKGIIPPAVVPEGWGLLEMQESGRISVTIEAGWMESDRPSEVAFLLSVIRRMGPSPLKGMGVKFYTLEGKRNGTVGIEPLEIQQSEFPTHDAIRAWINEVFKVNGTVPNRMRHNGKVFSIAEENGKITVEMTNEK